ISIACTVGDLGAGLANAADASFSLTTNVAAGTETANATTTTRAVCDKAGNCATAGPVTGNKVDKKGPVITVTQPTATTYLHSATLTLSYTVGDGGSGLKTFTATLDGSTTLAGHGLANGQPISLLTELPLGPHTFKVDAVDNVANTSSLSVTFTIAAALVFSLFPASAAQAVDAASCPDPKTAGPQHKTASGFLLPDSGNPSAGCAPQAVDSNWGPNSAGVLAHGCEGTFPNQDNLPNRVTPAWAWLSDQPQIATGTVVTPAAATDRIDGAFVRHSDFPVNHD